MGDLNLHILALVTGSAIWLWYNFSKARELVIKKATLACARQEVQLLDASVTLKYISIKRDNRDKYRLLRGYQFDFSLNGYDRFPGYIILFGTHIERIQFDHPDGRIIFNDDNVVQIH